MPAVQLARGVVGQAQGGRGHDDECGEVGVAQGGLDGAGLPPAQSRVLGRLDEDYFVLPDP